MGSLPNLHALTAAEEERPRSQPGRGVGVGAPPPQYRHHRYRHGACWDDYMIEMSAYSPIGNRSTSHSARRRDSLSSSGGASSVRRLIAVVRSTPSRLGPAYSRRLLVRNFVALCMGHGTMTAAFLPLVVLQAAVSVWWWPPSPSSSAALSGVGVVAPGALLLSALFGAAALSALCAPALVQRVGAKCALLLGYAHACAFLALHLYPRVPTLAPAYLLMGAWQGPVACATAALMHNIADKLVYVSDDDDDDDDDDDMTGMTGAGTGAGRGLVEAMRRDAVLQRLARGMQGAHDIGLVLGNLTAALLLWYTMPPSGMPGTSSLDALFMQEDSGERVCGSSACPVVPTPSVTRPTYYANASASPAAPVVPCKTSALLASVFLGCGVMALALSAAFLDRLATPPGAGALSALRDVRDAVRDVRLQLAAPLCLFIGLEQGYLYADFSKSYVMCALHIHNISLVFLSLGLLQAVAAFTLSLLLQHIRRCLAIVAGVMFHACLLLVLALWKPAGDDPALFYVICAAWGGCNAVWETLTVSFLLRAYPDRWSAPHAHAHFCRWLGLAAALGAHGALCDVHKLYALAAALVVAAAASAALEAELRRRAETGARAPL